MPVALVLPMLAVAATTLVAATPAHAAVQTLAFEYTGRAQTWTVPAGITQATFDVYGAQGGLGGFAGGLGGRATATLPVTPGSVIQLNVGGQGLSKPPPNQPVECVLVTGGFNGGGDGGTGCTEPGGGGASDVRIGGTTLTDRKLVAGGGGGGAGNLICNTAGEGGGLTGGSGTTNFLCSGSGTGGNQDGTSGSGLLGQGGKGADQDGFSGAGSGGGGGYYGGGGGQPGLPGGGGSGFGPPGTTFQNGVRAGNGRITVTFGDAPSVTGLSPNVGPPRGGFVVAVSGTNFVPGQTTVTFGTTPATSVDCPSATLCNAESPAGTGTVSVRVTVATQVSADTPADDYTYVPAPTLTSVSPAAGPAGTVVTVDGTGFYPDTYVRFGANPPVLATCASATRCTAPSPSALGRFPVSVITQSGESGTIPFDAVPSITGLSPAGGPAAGGTVVTITGTGFSTTPGATSVTFGGGAATAVGCASTTTCTAVSPPGSGTVSVRVTVAGQQSLDVPADDFTYGVSTGDPPPRDRLAALLAAVRGTGSVGTALARVLDRAIDFIEAGRPVALACNQLRVFLIKVRNGAERLTPTQASQFTAEATAVRTALACR